MCMKHWYAIYVFAPSVLSCICSSILVINVVRGNYKKYFFHQMSAILAFFDVVQCCGIFLDAPWLNHTCYPASYFFLTGSLCKVLAITYVTVIITHVILYIESPSKKRKLIYSSVTITLGMISTIVMPVVEVAEILCFDKDPVTFNYNDVSFFKRRMFFVFYAMPVSIMFFLIMFLTIYSIYRMRDLATRSDSKPKIRLLRRLIPLSLVFFIAFTPTAIFFLRGYITDKENFTNKTFAIFGQVISGTLYCMCYGYFCYLDYTYVSKATKRILDIERQNESELDARDRVSSMDEFVAATHGVFKSPMELSIVPKTRNPLSSETI